jgi:Protein of unknown function (DUF3954)
MNTARNVDMAHDTENMVAEIDLKENGIYIVRNGSITKLDSPETGFGTHTIKWEHRKPVRATKEESIHFD